MLVRTEQKGPSISTWQLGGMRIIYRVKNYQTHTDHAKLMGNKIIPQKLNMTILQQILFLWPVISNMNVSCLPLAEYQPKNYPHTVYRTLTLRH